MSKTKHTIQLFMLLSLFGVLPLALSCGTARKVTWDEKHPASSRAAETPMDEMKPISPGVSSSKATSKGRSMDKGLEEKASAIEPSAEVVHYSCPMHPEIDQTKPGTCPKCGMKLLPKVK